MPHINPNIDHTVEVVIVHDNKVLLRMHDKFHKWLTVGGHIEPNEDLIEAAYREVREEVGLEIEIIDEVQPNFKEGTLLPRPKGIYSHNITAEHRHVSFVFFAKAITTDIKPETTSITEAAAECRWYTKEDIETMKGDMPEDIYYFANEALKMLI